MWLFSFILCFFVLFININNLYTAFGISSYLKGGGRSIFYHEFDGTLKTNGVSSLSTNLWLSQSAICLIDGFLSQQESLRSAPSDQGWTPDWVWIQAGGPEEGSQEWITATPARIMFLLTSRVWAQRAGTQQDTETVLAFSCKWKKPDNIFTSHLWPRDI